MIGRLLSLLAFTFLCSLNSGVQATTCPGDGIDITNTTVHPLCVLTNPTQCTATQTCTDSGGQGYCCPAVTTTPKTTTGRANFTTHQSTVVNTCADTVTTCNNYKDLCGNAAYKYMLNEKCAKTCKYCTVNTVGMCIDAKTECETWSLQGFCTSPSYTDETKEAYCQKTCNFCPGATKAPTTGSTTGNTTKAATTVAGKKRK